jgi:hypothetical protein
VLCNAGKAVEKGDGTAIFRFSPRWIWCIPATPLP